MNSKVDEYLRNAKRWRDEMAELRMIVLDCRLTEELKWDAPCYAFQKHNVAMIGEFKESCVLSFFKGALLKDDQGILAKPGANTQTIRVIRFTSVREIVELEPILKAYLLEAIEVEKLGLKMTLKKNPEPIPEERRYVPSVNPAYDREG